MGILSRERDQNRLLHAGLELARKITHAEGGVLYLLRDDRSLLADRLSFDSLPNEVLWDFSGEGKKSVSLPLFINGKENLLQAICYSVLKNQVVNVRDIYEEDRFSFPETKNFDFHAGYRSKSSLLIPLGTQEGEMFGVMQLINPSDPRTGLGIAFGDEEQIFCEFIATQVAIVRANIQLTDERKHFFMAFGDVIATAIDEHSPHTGQHCKRVPVITTMLAEAADEADWGVFRNFSISKVEKDELYLAALLHDCGKIATPNHVIDKGKKLETLCDRINLVNTRFEIYARDQAVDYLVEHVVFLSGQDRYSVEKMMQEFLTPLQSRLKEEQRFIEKINFGVESMNEDDQQLVESIAKKTWKDLHGELQTLLTEDELDNLKVTRGTLNTLERGVMNHHIDLTIEMLDKLPYPKDLSRVPEFAAAHHEHMDGSGYPKGLGWKDMSLQARIVGVAEIFEALSAADRPYRKAKPLSEVLYIMGRMKVNKHIDPDVFDLLVSSRVFLKYADQFLRRDQVDYIDFANIPGYSRAPVEFLSCAS